MGVDGLTRVAIAGCALLLLPSVAGAQTEPGRVSLIAGTDAPVFVGGGLGVGLGRGLRVTSVAGGAVGPYLDLVHAVVSASISLPDAQSDALRRAIGGAVAWRTHLGWRPWPARGFELALGYGLLVVSGDVTTELAYTLAGTPASERVTPPPPPYGVKAWLHQVDVEAAWRVRLDRAVALRFGLDVAITFASATTIAQQHGSGAESASARAIRERSEAVITDWFTRWRVLPSLAVAVEITL